MDNVSALSSRALKGGGGGGGSSLNFPHISLAFVLSSWFLATAYILTLRYLRRGRSRLDGDGLFVLNGWSDVVRMIVSFIWMFFICIPAALLTNGWVFGGLIALVEDWALEDGYYYAIANFLGLFNALTTATPDTTSGDYLALAFSIYALIVTFTVVGFLTMLQLVVWQSYDVPDTFCGLLRYVLLYIPCGLLLVGTVMGGLVAGVEDWSFKDGFFHMTGTLCAIANPIDDQVIDTQSGMFFESYCACLNLGVMAMVITVVTQHPVFFKLVSQFEGKFQDYFETRQENVMKYNAEQMDFEDEALRKAKEEADAAIMQIVDLDMSAEVYNYVKSLENECRTLQDSCSRLKSFARKSLTPSHTKRGSLTKEMSGELSSNVVSGVEERSTDLPGTLPATKASES